MKLLTLCLFSLSLLMCSCSPDAPKVSEMSVRHPRWTVTSTNAQWRDTITNKILTVPIHATNNVEIWVGQRWLITSSDYVTVIGFTNRPCDVLLDGDTPGLYVILTDYPIGATNWTGKYGSHTNCWLVSDFVATHIRRNW